MQHQAVHTRWWVRSYLSMQIEGFAPLSIALKKPDTSDVVTISRASKNIPYDNWSEDMAMNWTKSNPVYFFAIGSPQLPQSFNSIQESIVAGYCQADRILYYRGECIAGYVRLSLQ